MTNLASIFTTIENASNHVEELATQIIEAIREAQASTLADFNEMVSDAYREKNWSQQVGRPAEDSTLLAAPPTIRNYVSTIRKAYKMDLDVMGFATMFDIRKAVRMQRQPVHGQQVAQRELKGIRLTSKNKPNGGLWHDLVLLWEHLPEVDKETLETKLQKLLAQFTKKADISLAA